MPWVKIDDGFAEHPKIEEAGPLAGFLHVAALCYCNRQLTDGFIPENKVGRLADIPNVKRHIAALCAVELWHPVDGGYQIHNYLEFQPSRAKVEAEREEARKRMARARAAKKNKDDDGDPFDDGDADVLEMFARTGAERSGEVRSTRPDPSASAFHLSETPTCMAYEAWA